jgi:aspartyl/asparaginyl beta-hydroxylase (cupin superfamily)
MKSIPSIYFILLRAIHRFFDIYTGGIDRPVFFDVAKTYPSLLNLEDNFGTIRKELSDILPFKSHIPRYHELDSMQHYISAQVNPDKAWNIFMLYAMGEKPLANRKQCPNTVELLDSIPGIFQAFFSILEGGKAIPSHEGPYRGYLRYHLALIVPIENPPSIRIKDLHYTWKEMQSILFDDSWSHEVYNKSNDIRVLLIVDILRPMPLPFTLVNVFVSWIIRCVYAKGLMKNIR